MTNLLSFDEALSLLTQHAPQAEAEVVPVGAAMGRILAEPVTAQVDRPIAPVSAMDGYAVRREDVREPGGGLTGGGAAPAGAPYGGTVGPGEAVRIFTGGVVPDGADHIVIQETVDRDGDDVICRERGDGPSHVRAAGRDFRAGDVLLPLGHRLSAADLAVAAAANHSTLAIRKPLRVGLLANGDELKPPGAELGPGDVVNANAPALSALVAQWGGEAIDLGVARDELDDIRARIDGAADIDVFLPVGGASVGAHDLMRPAFDGAGFAAVFARVAVRPGKPTWFSTREGQCVLGLPGNPASALVCAHLFLKPLLTGAAPVFHMAETANPIAPEGARETFLRAAVCVDGAGRLLARAASDQDSSLLRPFIDANALIRRAAHTPALKAGEAAPCLLIGAL